MRSPLRQSPLPTVLLAFVIGVSAAAAPNGLRGNPTDTRVAGIDIDATTIPELQQLMNSRRLKSVQLTQFYLHRIH
jgi:amidase